METIPDWVADRVELRSGPHAVQVSAWFAGALQQVRHLDGPTAGPTRWGTRALLGLAALSLAGVFLLFVAAYLQVGDPSQVGDEPAAQAAQPGGRWRDFGAAGLLGLGAAALLYGLWRWAGERRENGFSIGADPKATFPTLADGLPCAYFPLVRWTGTDYELHFPPTLVGEVTADGQTRSLTHWTAAGQARPSAQVPGALVTQIPHGARFSLQLGTIRYDVQSVARPRRGLLLPRAAFRQHAATAAVFLAAVGIGGLAHLMPAKAPSLQLESSVRERVAKIQILFSAPWPAADRAAGLRVSRPAPQARFHRHDRLMNWCLLSTIGCGIADTGRSICVLDPSPPNPVVSFLDDTGLLDVGLEDHTDQLGTSRARPRVWRLGMEGKRTTVRNRLDQAQVLRVLRRHWPQVTSCYQVAPRPDRPSRLELHVSISAAGGVLTSFIPNATAGSWRSTQCVADQVRQWTFPKRPSGIIQVTFPFSI